MEKRGVRRKGQVTIFVILAIVVLLIGGFFIYLNSTKKISVTPPERTTVSDQFKPVQLLVEDCMESVAREAVEKLGKHGGYIDPYDAYLSGRLFYVNNEDQTESDLAYLSEDEDKAIAFWYYSYDMSGCDNCMMMSQAPYVDEMERQISIYVSENIYLCINDFETFKNQGYDIQTDDTMLVKTTLREEDILIESIYNINVTYKNSKESIDKYLATVDIPLIKYYEMALNITSQEYDSQFLEGLNSYLILSHSGLNSELLPPLYAYSNGYNIVFWSKTAVKKNIEQLLSSYVPLMQVKGAKNYRPIVSNNLSLLEKNFIDLITLDLFPDRNLEKTEISFIYTGQDTSMDIQPSKNELLGPTQDFSEGILISSPKETNTYQFFYDVSYPVIVEIKDEYKPGEYYTFMFALESTIKQNLPLKEWWNASKRPLYFDKDIININFNDPLIGQNLKDPITGAQYPYKERVQDKLFCDENQRISGEVYLKTYDSATKQPLENVDVTFGCGNYASCLIGRTTYEKAFDVQSFTGKMPLCINGYVQLEKFGYQKKIVKLTTGLSDVNMGSIYLEPIKKVNTQVKVYNMERNMVSIAGNEVSVGLLFPNQSFPPEVNDTITLILTRIPTGFDEPLTQTIFISKDANNTAIDLIPGRYTLSGNLIAGEGYTIPKECDEVCDNYVLGICTGHKKFPEDNLLVKPALLGGVEFDKTSPLNVKREDLLNNKTLELYLLKLPSPPCIDEMQEINMIKSLSQSHRIKVMPVFK